MIQDSTRSGEASGLDGTVQANRAGQLDQGNVIAGTSEKIQLSDAGAHKKVT